MNLALFAGSVSPRRPITLALMTAVPRSGTAGAAVVEPGTVVDVGGIPLEDGGITGIDDEGGTLTVDGSLGTVVVVVEPGIFVIVRFAFARSATFTLLSLSLLRNKKKSSNPKRTTAPAIAGIAHGGIPSLRCLTTATAGSGETSGRPQFGQATALADTSWPHSGQKIRDMILSSLFRKTSDPSLTIL
jgi:hypothetical protein